MVQTRIWKPFEFFNTIFMIIVILACVIPFVHIIAISLSGSGPILQQRVSFYPIELDWTAYKKVIMDSSIIRSIGFTFFLTAVFTVFAMTLTIFAAYPLSKSKLKGRSFFMFVIVFTMFFSGGLIPEYMLIKSLGLLDSFWVMVLPTMVSPFYLIIMRSFFMNIPESLEESAHMDGASHFQILWRVILPLSLPVLATLSLFYAVYRWNSFTDALYYINNINLFPIQMKLFQIIVASSMTGDLAQLEGNSSVVVQPESIKAASVIYATIPILLAYPWLQRYFVSGIMLGAVKG